MNVFLMQNSIVRPLGRDMQNVLIGFVGEHEARTFFVRTRDDLTGYTISLVIGDVDCGAMTKAPMPDGSTMLSLTLTSDMLGKGGDKVCQLLMTKDAIVRKSSQFRAYVGASNDINSTAPDSATIIIISEKITELVHEAALDAIEEVQEVIDSIPSNYSALSAQVDTNTEDIDGLKADIINYNSYDVFKNLLTRTSGASNGITYTWSGDVCTVAAGTASSYSANIMLATSMLPNNVKVGDKFYVKYSTTDSKVRLRIIFKTAANVDVETYYFESDDTLTIPTGAEKWTISLFVSKNVVLSSNVTVSDIHFINAKTNEELEADIKTLNDNLALCLKGPNGILSNNTDLNSVTSSGCYILSSINTYSNLPPAVRVALLCVFPSSATSVTQMVISENHFYRRVSYSGVFNAWKNDGLANYGVIPTNTDLDTIKETGIWFITSSYVYTHNPLPAGYGGMMLVFKYSNNSILQIASTAGTGDVFFRASLAGNFPSDWGTGGAVNNYITEYYENTYNITCSPTITTDTNNYLASTGDNTDRTGDIQTMLNTTGVCHLGAGKFVVTGVSVPDYAALIGSGDRTLIVLADSVTSGYAVKLNNYSSIFGLRINGGSTAQGTSDSVGTRHGILFEGTKRSGQSGGATKKRSKIDKCTINNFAGGGITLTGTGVDLDSNLLISDCFVDHCGAGLYIPYYSEFHRICNCSFSYNYYGCVDNGGNNNFVNCDFSGNKIGLLIDNSTDQSPNVAHGSFTNCSVNHSYSDGGVINEGTAIKLLKANLGEIFTGMQIFYGAIIIDDCVGIRFIGANVGSKVPITITDSTVVTFSDCTFKEAPDHADSTFTQSGNTVLKFRDCYLRNGTAYDPMN